MEMSYIIGAGEKTYIEVLEKLGLEAVMRVCPNIVSTEPFAHAFKRGKFLRKNEI